MGVITHKNINIVFGVIAKLCFYWELHDTYVFYTFIPDNSDEVVLIFWPVCWSPHGHSTVFLVSCLFWTTAGRSLHPSALPVLFHRNLVVIPSKKKILLKSMLHILVLTNSNFVFFRISLKSPIFRMSCVQLPYFRSENWYAIKCGCQPSGHFSSWHWI